MSVLGTSAPCEMRTSSGTATVQNTECTLRLCSCWRVQVSQHSLLCASAFRPLMPPYPPAMLTAAAGLPCHSLQGLGLDAQSRAFCR